MDNLELRRYETLVRVRDYGATYVSLFPPTSLGGELFAGVNAVVTELDSHAVKQSSGASTARQSSTSKAVARAALREDLEALTRTARALAIGMPGLEEKFRMPRKASDQELVNTARTFAADASPLKAEFIRHEMPADFLEDLQSDIDAFEEAINQKNVGRDTRVTATAAIDDVIERGMILLRQLDAIVRNKFRDDPSKLAAWTSASHVERAPRTRREQGATTPAPAS